MEPDFDKIEALISHREIVHLPWESATEDRWAAQEAVITLYASLHLPKPRMAWAPSPASLHAASRMLRTVQHGTAWNMVQALVPYSEDRIEREARVSLLAAMIDPDVTTQNGGLIIGMLRGVFGNELPARFPVLADLRSNHLNFKEEKIGTASPPRFIEQCLWPAFYPGFSAQRLYALQRQAMLIMPFTKVCWLCRPPLYIRTNEFGMFHCADGPAAEWSDGFKVFCDRTPEAEKVKLTQTKMKALPEPAE